MPCRGRKARFAVILVSWFGFRWRGASHRTFPLPKAKKRLTFSLKLLANAELSN
jgi:hypothetical protein